jgi:ADP-heptose:LPS heptosyltransferase
MNWNACKNILCIRADNMGDVIMSGPAIRALKESFGCRLTLLTSSMGSLIAPCLPDVDDVLVYNVPWIKADHTLNADACSSLIAELKEGRFDGVVIFTAYSQSALPAAMLAYMAGIPLRLAYCRENPYQLLTHWVPDKEPYSIILHQVKRDLELVASIGAQTPDTQLSLRIDEKALQSAFQKLAAKGIDIHESWIVVHTGVSEKKREYPIDQWIETVRLLHQHFDLPILLTGSSKEMQQAHIIQQAAGGNVHVVAGLLSIEEFIAVIHEAQLVISVNTATIHIAAATDTPVIVLYALTNPQHTPWSEYAKVLPFPVKEPLKSKNQVVNFVSDRLFGQVTDIPSPSAIVQAAIEILEGSMQETNKAPFPLFYETRITIR